MRVVFPYFAQLHQVLHSLPIAAEMALRHPDVQVHAAAAKDSHLRFIRSLVARYAPDAPLHIDKLQTVWLSKWRPAKRRTMRKNRRYLLDFDAIVTPERTSLFMRQLGLGDTRLIWTRHGAGDRAIGFAANVQRFDYVLTSGRKIEQRLLAAGLIRAGRYTSGVYAKFDWLRAEPDGPTLFANPRPTVLYNPHFDPALSSWPVLGAAVLDFFARSERYNLIFAPHVRLFDQSTARHYRAFARYAALPHLRIDLGSERSIDMSYSNAADLYLGDVSSQVSEFVCRPRPCLFFNAHRVRWQDNPDYRFWNLGVVVESMDQFDARLDEAFAQHTGYREAQQQYVAETFDVSPEGTSSAARGADAIVAYLKSEGRS